METTNKNVATATSENKVTKMASETVTNDIMQSIPLHKDTAMMLEAMKLLEQCYRLTRAALEETNTPVDDLVNLEKMDIAQEAVRSLMWDVVTSMMLAHTYNTEMKDYLAAL